MPDSDFAAQFDRSFNFNTEANVPTFFNVILLFMAAQTFFLIGHTNAHGQFYFRTYWYVIAFVFAFLSIDEFAQIHEWFNGALFRKFGIGGSGFLRFSWIIPYGVLVILFCFYSFKILFSLKRRQLLQYAGAGTIFLSGALVMESLGGNYLWRNNNVEDFTYFIYFTSAEESFEMLSMVWLLDINLNYLTKEQP